MKALIFVTLAISSQLVMAAENGEVSVAAGIDYGFKRSSMASSINGGPYQSAYSPSYITLIPSISVSYGNTYAVVSHDAPITEYHASSGGTSSNVTFEDATYTRQETIASFGYRFSPTFAAFVGYINGETTIRSVTYNVDLGTGILVPYPGKVSFNTDGYFAGLSASYRFDGRGTLAVSGAYASMSGTIHSSYSNVSGTLTANNSSGYSTSVSWTGPLGGDFYYKLGYRYAKYHYEFQSQAAVKVDEPVQGITVGILKSFN